MIAVYRKELKSCFCNMTGVFCIAWILVWIGFYTRYYQLQQSLPNFEYVCMSSAFLAFLVLPILTMRSFAEERAARTDQLLFSLPMSTAGIVIGKYLALVTVLAIPMGISAVYPLLFSAYGKVALPTAYAALLALFLLGCALIAVCMFISSLTESQIISAVLSFGVVIGTYMMKDWSSSMSGTAVTSFIALLVLAAVIGLLTYLLTKNTVVGTGVGAVLVLGVVIFYAIDKTRFEGLVPDMLSQAALFNRMMNYAYGLMDLTSLVLYLTVAAMFLFFTGQSLEKKRWC